MLIGWVRPLFYNTCLCHFILVMDIVLWHWPPPNLQCHICHMFYDPLHAVVSMQMAHPRYLPLHAAGIRFSGCLCCHYLLSVHLVIVTVLCSPCQQQFRIKLLASLRPTFFWRVQSQVTTATHRLSSDLIPDWWWLDCWIVWLTVSCTVIGVIITSLVTPRDSVTVSGAGSGSRVTCHVARNL